MFKALDMLDRVFHFEKASAHCDIPCGIYDPHLAELAALTVVRMDDLIDEMARTHKETDLEYRNNLPRYVAVKEEHAEICKREVRVIWGDYFKPDMIAKYPEVSDLVYQIMVAGSKARQTADRQNGMDLLNKVNRFAEIYWETKGIGSKRVKAPYKPGEEMVLPNL